ncbi:unnamed protein product [Umbelopsis vinacea]
METATSIGLQIATRLSNNAPQIGTLKRKIQAMSWADWPEYVRAQSREWLPLAVWSVIPKHEGEMPGKLYKIDKGFKLRKRGCTSTLTAHAGSSLQQYFNCVVVILSLSGSYRHEAIHDVRNVLSVGLTKVEDILGSLAPLEIVSARAEYTKWVDALCIDLVLASQLLGLDRRSLDVNLPRVLSCLKNLVQEDVVKVDEALQLLAELGLGPDLRQIPKALLCDVEITTNERRRVPLLGSATYRLYLCSNSRLAEVPNEYTDLVNNLPRLIRSADCKQLQEAFMCLDIWISTINWDELDQNAVSLYNQGNDDIETDPKDIIFSAMVSDAIADALSGSPMMDRATPSRGLTRLLREPVRQSKEEDKQIVPGRLIKVIVDAVFFGIGQMDIYENSALDIYEDSALLPRLLSDLCWRVAGGVLCMINYPYGDPADVRAYAGYCACDMPEGLYQWEYNKNDFRWYDQQTITPILGKAWKIGQCSMPLDWWATLEILEGDIMHVLRRKDGTIVAMAPHNPIPLCAPPSKKMIDASKCKVIGVFDLVTDTYAEATNDTPIIIAAHGEAWARRFSCALVGYEGMGKKSFIAVAEGDGLGGKVPGEYDFVIDDMVVPNSLGGTGKICLDDEGRAYPWQSPISYPALVDDVVDGEKMRQRK